MYVMFFSMIISKIDYLDYVQVTMSKRINKWTTHMAKALYYTRQF